VVARWTLSELDWPPTSGQTVNATFISGLSNPVDIVIVPEPSVGALLAVAAVLIRRNLRKN
jgi:hypothetical protein